MPETESPRDGRGGLGFAAQLWAAADKMRGHLDPSEYKNDALGFIFLKFIPVAFEEKRKQLHFAFSNPKSEWLVNEEISSCPDRQPLLRLCLLN
jgi:type I restriction-modification system DNA methylase subunit